VIDLWVEEPVFAAAVGESLGLGIGPAVTRVAASAGLCLPFDGNEATGRLEHAACLFEPDVYVDPVVHRRDRPRNRRGGVRDRQGLGGPLEVMQVGHASREETCDPQHDGRGIDAGHAGTEVCRVPCRDARPATDVHHGVTGTEMAESCGQASVALPADGHAERSDQPGRTREALMVRVMVGDGARLGHAYTLTVESGFKSSVCMPERLLTIGEVGRRAHVSTSTIRYYERRGLLAADARTSGQRRYRNETLRRLVFIGMLQDAGLALDEIHGILGAAGVKEWKAIAARRLEHLDDEIARLGRAREYLAGALFCRYDHPATDCKIMGTEIDRRLAETGSRDARASETP